MVPEPSGAAVVRTGGAAVGSLLAAAVGRLAAAGVDTPRLDAELLLAEVLGVDRSRLIIDRDQPVGEAAVERFDTLLSRREAREPVAYILGRRDFRYLTLRVDPRVLIPRPETELLVEVGLELPAGASVLDIGTGSGAVALALASERPDLRVRGVDVSGEAVEVARGNALALGLDVPFAVADLYDGQPCDAVLANLPYVPAQAGLPPEITGYEPAVALYGGEDGLDLVRRLVDMVGSANTVRLIGLEIGIGQWDAVVALLEAAGWSSVHARPDLAGIPRVVVGRR